MPLPAPRPCHAKKVLAAPPPVNIFFQNIQCLKNKISELDLLNSEINPSVICLAEHWCSEDQLNKINLDGYVLKSSFCRSRLKCGGVSIFTKNNLLTSELKINQNLIKEKDFEICAIELIDQKTIVLCIYRAPDGNLDNFFSSLEELLSLYSKKANIFVCGDLNIDYLTDSNEKLELFNIFLSHNLTNLLDAPTRVTSHSSTGLDYIITNANHLTNSAEIIKSGLSDHYGLKVELNLNNIDRKIYYWSRNISQQKTVNFIRQLEKSNHAQMNCEQFQTHISEFCNLAFPPKKFSCNRPQKQWVTPEIRNSSKRLKELHREKIRNALPEFHIQYLNYKKVHRKLISTAKKTYNDQKIVESHNKSKTIWTIVKKETNQIPEVLDKIIPIRNNQNQPFIDHVEQASYINQFFCEVGLQLQNGIPQTPRPAIPAAPVQFKLEPVSPEEVTQCINDLKNKSTFDLYGFSTKLLRNFSQPLIIKLTDLVNESFISGIFPDSLKIAKVLPIYKGKGDKTKVENYRPISILPALSKVFEKLIKTRLMKHLTENGYIDEHQHGFLPGKSTETAILDFTDKIIDALDDRKKVSGVFLDLSKAFDTVDHTILLEKLQAVGILGNELNLFRSYLQNRKQAVSIDFLDHSTNTLETCISPLLPVEIGVPQGSVLGPPFFLVYTSDLSENLASTAVIYADDTNCLFIHSTIPDLQSLAQREINSLANYFKRNRLTLNSQKTFIIDFSCRANAESINLSIGSDQIRNTETTKLLGIDLDHNLNWHSHADKLSAKLNSICFTHRILSESCSLEILKIAYFAYFHSLLSYGIVFWGAQIQNLNKIFVVQKKCIRIISKVAPKTHSKPLFQNLQILPAPCVYIYKCALLIRSQRENLALNSDIHSHNTRNKSNLHQLRANTNLKQNSPIQIGIKIFNALPVPIKTADSIKSFKTLLFRFLIDNVFFSANDFFQKTIGLD